MSENQYSEQAHHCPNAKNPSALAGPIVHHTVIKVGYAIDSTTLNEVVGYREKGIGLRDMGELCQEGNELEGRRITVIQYDRTAEVFRMKFSGGQIPGVDSIGVTLPSGANFTATWQAGYNGYVYPFPDNSGDFDSCGITVTLHLVANTGP